MKSTKTSCMTGSNPLVGSSRISTSGSLINAATTASFRLTPRLMRLVSPEGSSSKIFNRYARRSSLRHFCSACIMRRNSQPVSPAGSAISPGIYPTLPRISKYFSNVSRPKIFVEPLSGLENPIRCRMVVDFPAPLGPRNPNTSPLSTRKDTSKTPRPEP